MEDQERTQSPAEEVQSNGTAPEKAPKPEKTEGFFSKFFGFVRANKWLVAFIATAVALIAAVTVAIVIGVSSRPDPIPPEGSETGVYYYDVADGEMTISLNSGNKFSIAGPSYNKSGTYTVDGANITLDFLHDEDGTASAVVVGNALVVTLKDAEMTFLKKVSFSVNFNTNGGNSIDTLKVLNGKTFNKPNDPTKEGNVFLGWYADEALTQQYDFTSETVTADVTLYAKWIEYQIGGSFAVDYDLGYAGAPALDATTTISGVLTETLPTPTREGYTFGGWWISMYEDGEKLTYAYTEDTVFTADTTLFAVWYEASDKIASPAVSVKANALSWNNVSDATLGYKVVITNAAGVVIKEETVATTTVAFDFTALDAGDYTVSVTALAQSEAQNSEPTVRYYANKALDRVWSFQVIDGILVYNAVENATAYLITVDCGNDSHDHTAFNNGTSTSFSLVNCPMQVGGIKITVTAQANGYASSTSEVFVYDRTLAPIGTVVYNAETDTIVWEAVAFATTYKVTVTVGEETYTFNIGNKTSFALSAFSGDIAYEVTPVTEGFNSPAAAEGSCTKTAPATPTGVTANGMVISWNAVAGATEYEIKVGSLTLRSETTSIDLSNTVEIVPNNFYDVSVKAVKGVESSAYTAPISVGYRVMGQNLSYSNGVVSWSPVLGVSNYLVRVNGNDETAITVNGATSAKITLTKEGVNLVEVKYIDNGGSEWVSLEVVAYAVKYMPRNGESEVTAYYAIGDTMTHPVDFTYAGYDFTAWYTSPAGAAGNGKLVAQGATFAESGSIALYAEWTPVTYEVEIQVDAAFEVGNLTDKAKYPATYTKGFTLPVPVSSNSLYTNFVGWFTGPAGSGTKLTDSEGNSVVNYPYTRDSIVYPFFDTGILNYNLQSDGTYAVSKGPEISNVTSVTIPYSYNGIPVTTIVEKGFANCSNLKVINIPNTIKLVGIDAFYQSNKIEAINVYEVEGNHEVFYASDDGALIRYDMGTTYLEVFPRGKTGTYVMSDEVEVILSKAFYYSNIDTIVIGKGLTSIPKYSFYYAKALKTVDFAEGRTASLNIESSGFYGCTGVTSFTVPATMTSEITSTLRLFSNLAAVKVEEGNPMYAVVDGLLTNAEKTEIIFAPPTRSGELTIPRGIQSIAQDAFYNCKRLTSITISTQVRTIGETAFYGCEAVTSVTFEGGRSNANYSLNIGKQAFGYLKALKTVTFKGSADGTLENGTITIGEKAFEPNLENKAIPVLDTVTFEAGVNVVEIGAHAFENQQNIATLTYGENAKIAKIGDYAFAGVKGLKSIEIPATTTTIGNNAFADCTNVVTITLNEGEDLTIGDYAFQNCSKMHTIYIPSTVSNFNGSAFDGCDMLTQIEVDEDNTILQDVDGVLYKTVDGKVSLLFYPKAIVKENSGIVSNILAGTYEISSSVFANVQDLTQITIPNSVYVIGEKAFYNCAKLTKVNFTANEAADASLTIGNYAFAGCESLKNNSTAMLNRNPFTLPAYTTSIGDGAFEACKFVTFPIPEAVTTIGAGAFKDNKSLTTITIPAKVTSIGNSAFSGCEELTTFTVTESTTPLTLGTAANEAPKAADGVFYNCAKLETVTLGNRVSSIGDYAFSALKKLTSITLSDNLTTIGKFAFNKTPITSVTIPNTVENIYDSAFAGASASDPGLLGKTGITFVGGGTAPLAIHPNAFAYQTTVTTITLPERIAHLYEETAVSTITYKNVVDRFTGMTALASINIANDLTESSSCTFASKDGVLYEVDENGTLVSLLYCPFANTGDAEGDGKTLTIPKTVTLVENGAFYDVRTLTTIKFEEFAETDENYGKQLVSIGSGTHTSLSTSYYKYAAFGGGASNSITSISFPSHLKYLGYFAVSRTKNTVSISFNEAMQPVEVATGAFYYCSATSLNIPKVAKLNDYAFYYLQKATSITFGFDGLTKIPNRAFAYCSALESITIPETVTEIDIYAFYSCKALKSVIFEGESKLTTIGNYAFYSCEKLESFDFTKTKKLSSMGTYCFYGCNALTSVDFSECSVLTNLGERAFQNCKGLTSFTFPASVTSVGPAFLLGCEKIKTITLSTTFSPQMLSPSGSTPIFYNMASLEKVIVPEGNPYFVSDEYGALYDPNKTIVYLFPMAGDYENYVMPSTVKQINGYSFMGYRAKSIVLPEGLEVIGNDAFYGAELTSITIPASVQMIDEYAFYYCENLASVTFAPQSVLKSIGYSGFNGCSKLTSIVFPDNVEELGDYAFQDCTALESVTLSAALKAIPTYAFEETTSLAEIIIQEQVESIGTYAFYNGGKNVKDQDLSIYIPAKVKTIDTYAFYNMVNLRYLTFAKDGVLESIGNNAFRNSKVEKLVFPPMLQSLSPSAFYSSTTLKYVEFTGTAFTTLQDATFRGCSALETVILPEGLVTIGENAFAGGVITGRLENTVFEPCISLESITIPSTVTTIGKDAFAGCSALSEVIFAPGSALTALGDGIFKDTASLKNVTLPDYIQVIGNGAFENSAVETIYLGSALTTIGDNAFKNCVNLVEVELTPTLTYLGDYAFYGCSNLEEATPKVGLQYFGMLAFGYCEKLTYAYIPATVDKIAANPYAGCYNAEIVLDSGNIYYKFVTDASGNVVLYDNAMTALIYAKQVSGEFVIPESVTEVSAGAFAGTEIESIVFPTRMRDLQQSTFENCSKLTTVTIEDGIKSIGEKAFNNCVLLNNVSIPESVDSIGNYAFAGCKVLSSISFADKSELSTPYTLGTHIFDGCSAITEVILPNKWLITAEDYKTCAMGATEETQMKSNIPSYMFANTGIVTAVLPETVTDLTSEGVFMNCKALTDVVFEAKILDYESVGSYYFYGCSALTELELPANMQPYNPFTNQRQGYSFAYCTSLKTFTASYGQGSGLLALRLDSDPKNIFEGCTALETVTIKMVYTFTNPANDKITEVREIGTASALVKEMYKNSGIISFKFNEKVSVPRGAFDGTTRLESITLAPAQLSENAFKGATGIKNAYIYPYYYTAMSNLSKETVYKSKFYANAFDGWTSEQNIYFVTMTKAEFLELLELGLADTTPGATYEQIFANCNANIYFQEDIKAMTGTVNLGDGTSYLENEIFNGSAASEFVIGALNESITLADGLFAGMTAEQKITFSAYGYQDLYKFLTLAVLDGCEAKIYDKDGNLYVADADKNAIYVKNASNEVIALYVELPADEAQEDEGGNDEPQRPSIKDFAIKAPILIDPVLPGPGGDLGGGTEPEAPETDEALAAKLAILEALNLGSYTSLEAIYFIDATFVTVADIIGDAETFSAFAALASTVEIFDKDGNQIKVNDTTGRITEIVINPSYYELVENSGGAIAIEKSYISSIYEYNLSGLGEDVTVNLGNGQTYVDMLHMQKKYATRMKGNLKGVKATVVDGDGNTLEFNADGEMIKVLGSDGTTVVWEKPSNDDKPIGGGGSGPILPGPGPIFPGIK